MTANTFARFKAGLAALRCAAPEDREAIFRISVFPSLQALRAWLTPRQGDPRLGAQLAAVEEEAAAAWVLVGAALNEPEHRGGLPWSREVERDAIRRGLGEIAASSR